MLRNVKLNYAMKPFCSFDFSCNRIKFFTSNVSQELMEKEAREQSGGIPVKDEAQGPTTAEIDAGLGEAERRAGLGFREISNFRFF